MHLVHEPLPFKFLLSQNIQDLSPRHFCNLSTKTRKWFSDFSVAQNLKVIIKSSLPNSCIIAKLIFEQSKVDFIVNDLMKPTL